MAPEPFGSCLPVDQLAAQSFGAGRLFCVSSSGFQLDIAVDLRSQRRHRFGAHASVSATKYWVNVRAMLEAPIILTRIHSLALRGARQRQKRDNLMTLC